MLRSLITTIMCLVCVFSAGTISFCRKDFDRRQPTLVWYYHLSAFPSEGGFFSFFFYKKNNMKDHGIASQPILLQGHSSEFIKPASSKILTLRGSQLLALLSLRNISISNLKHSSRKNGRIKWLLFRTFKNKIKSSIRALERAGVSSEAP